MYHMCVKLEVRCDIGQNSKRLCDVNTENIRLG